MRAKQTIIFTMYEVTAYFVISVLIALFLNPYYQFFYQFLSILGTGELGWIFNIPLMLLGLIIPLYFILFYIELIDESHISIFLTLATIIAVPTNLLLFFLGYFPVEGSTADIHNILAFLYFFSQMIYLPIYCLSFYNISPSSEKEEKYLNQLLWIGLITTFLLILGLFGPSILSYTLQKLVVVLSLSFQIISSRLLL